MQSPPDVKVHDQMGGIEWDLGQGADRYGPPISSTISLIPHKIYNGRT
jgi:hypothetical protein